MLPLKALETLAEFKQKLLEPQPEPVVEVVEEPQAETRFPALPKKKEQRGPMIRHAKHVPQGWQNFCRRGGRW